MPITRWTAAALAAALASSAQTPSAQQTAGAFRPEWCEQLPRPAYKSLERVSGTGDWFEVYRIRPGVFAIYEPHQFQEVICYLISGTKKALLFDTGMGIADLRAVVEQLTSLPVTVLNSHTHIDHIGGNWQFSQIAGMHTEYTQKNTQGIPAERAKSQITPENLCGSLPAGVTPDTYSIRPFRISSYVSDGSKIDIGGRELEVVATPGHTPDSICLLDRRNGLLFTGDTFYLGPIYLFSPGTDFAAWVRSAERMAALAPGLKLVLPAHNVPAAGPESLLRLAAAAQAIQSGILQGEPKGRLREYKFDGFSILLRAD